MLELNEAGNQADCQFMELHKCITSLEIKVPGGVHSSQEPWGGMCKTKVAFRGNKFNRTHFKMFPSESEGKMFKTQTLHKQQIWYSAKVVLGESTSSSQ